MSDSDQLRELQEENARLKACLRELSLSNGDAIQSDPSPDTEGSAGTSGREWDGGGHGLSKEQVARYSRQILLPSFGVQAQAKLCNGSVLIIGAGGLGSPAAIYLAAAGVGRIGIVDKDCVELSNIHRQVIHTEASVGHHKTDSTAAALKALNSSITLELFREGFTPANAVELVSKFDVIVDASDNAPTRYLISDACAVAHRPLVSGAAIGTDGQLTVYCHGDDGPCYRCLFPVAPMPQSCARCVDAGVLGVVPGIIGTMQALEAVKLLSGIGDPMSRKLLIMDAMSARFHVVKLRARSSSCVACREDPEITKESLSSYDYAAFTGQEPSDAAPKPLQLLKPEQRMQPSELQARLASGTEHVLLDVRPPEQYSICHLPGSINTPWKNFDKYIEDVSEAIKGPDAGGGAQLPVAVLCRRGNDSQRAVTRLHELGIKHAVDVVGGVEGWAREIDPEFPTY